MCSSETKNSDMRPSGQWNSSTKARSHSSIKKDTIFGQIVHFILCLCVAGLVICLIPFLLPISLMFRIYRTVLIWRIKQVHGDKVSIMSGDDAVWLQDSKVNKTIISTVLLMKGRVDIEAYIDAVQTRLIDAKDPDDGSVLWFPKITQYPGQILHRYVWIQQEDFNIREHVFVYHKCVPQTKQELELMIGDMSSQALPPKKAPWRFIIIPPNVDNPDDYVILFRAHHSMADGISLVKILLAQIIDEVPDITVRPGRGFGSSGFLWRAVKALFVGPYMVIEKFLYPFDNHILHGQQLTGDKLVSWSAPIDLELIKKIKNHTGTTVNDVLMSCLAGSFGQYFRSHSSKPPKDILSYIPVDIRDPKQKPTLDNKFVLVFLRLPTSDDDPLTLLDVTKQRMDRIKSSAEPLVNSLIIRYCMARLPNWLTRRTFDMFAKKCSMILSNVPGYQTKLKLVGETIEDIIFWPPQRANVGLGISILSYAGHVRIGVMCDRALLSNPSVLVDQFVQQVQSLSQQLKLE